jgi:hypothetical protein
MQRIFSQTAMRLQFSKVALWWTVVTQASMSTSSDLQLLC